MRFINRKKRQFAGVVQGIKHGQRALDQQTLGGDINEIEGAVEELLLDRLRFPPVECRIQAGSTDAKLDQRIHLILHQRNQRRNDDGAAWAEQGRNLVAEAFAATGRHQDEGVTALVNMLDDLGLGAAKGRITEDVSENSERIHDVRHCLKADFLR